jgi:hypothetical protein
MPKVIDKVTGEVVAELPYDQSGENIATDMAANNPSLDVQFGENADFSPGGISNAQNRMVNSPFPTDVGASPDVGIGMSNIANAARWGTGEVMRGANIGQYNKGGKVKKGY